MAENGLKRGAMKRPYDEVAVDVLKPSQLAVVTDATQRYIKWERMRVTMLKAVGAITGTEPEDEGKPEVVTTDPKLAVHEHCYIVARAPHPLRDGTTVCLVEKGQGRGFTLLPESCLDTSVEARVQILIPDQQYSQWPAMEEKMGLKMTPSFKPKEKQIGYLIGKTPNPKQEGVEVAAIKFLGAEPKIAFIKLSALRVFPNDCVQVDDPDGKISDWKAMADALEIEETAGLKVSKGKLGTVVRERKHLKKPEILVVAVKLLDGSGTIMIVKEALKYVKS